MEYQPESNRLLYAQLLGECTRQVAGASRGLGFVSKMLSGRKHWYLQLVVGSAKTQHYLGPDSPDLRELMAKENELSAKAEPERKSREKLVAMLIAGGTMPVSAAEARVLELLERAGVFLVGGVVVGSHAFGVYANMLGVRWSTEAMRTHDIDVAAGQRLPIGVKETTADLRGVLLDAGMGFFEVPALNRKHPSTSFAIRGQQLTVDLLTPMLGRPSSKPVVIKALGSPATPVRFLEYLLEETEPAVVVARAGIALNVPAPARYALHKLVTSGRRPPAWQTKALKDLDQAGQLLDVLIADRPGDLALAWEAAAKQPPKFRQQMAQGLKRLPVPQQKRLRETI